MAVRYNLIIDLISISLITHEAENLIMHLFACLYPLCILH